MSTYYLKYYAEIQNFRGQLTRVEIHQRDTAPDSVLQIGDVCGLSLEIQGGTEDVFSPIIKTQARLSMISSDDKPTAGGIKYGDWGEFYTPDSTLYKFIIKTKANASSLLWETRWSGYITPDSWQEGLEYRSAITVTARDNIGHLQDFEFSENRPVGIDGYGLISIRALINHAMSLVEMPMTLEVNTDPGDIVADGTSVLDAMVSAQKFDDSNWYQVVEDLLDSIGYCLRYTDQNRFTLAPVRHLPLTGGTVQQQPVSLEFYGGDGEVVPAVKKVIEEHDYDYDGEAGLEVNGDYSVGSYNPYTYECYIPITNQNVVDRYPIHNAAAPYAKVTNPGGTVWNAGSDFWKPGPVSSIMGALEGEGWDNYIFLAANGIDGQVGDRHDLRTQSFRFHCGTPDVTLRLYFHRAPVTVVHWGSGWDPQPPLDWDGVVPMVEPFFGRAGLSKIRYKVKLEHGSTTLWWGANGWGSVDEVNEQEYDPLLQTTDVEIPLGANADIEDDIYLTLYIVHIEYSITQQTVAPLPTSSTTLTGCYARLSNATVEVNQTNLSKNTVRTFNDEKYNVTIKRTPAVAPLSRQVKIAVPSSYEDALFYYPAGEDFPKQYPYMVNWDTVQGNVTKPLPVLVHQQLLCYRGASLWELSGDCAPLAHGLFRFDKLVKYKQRTYLIQSGTIDYLSGTVSGVLLREFLAYDDIWDDTQEGDWEDDGIYGTIGGGSTGGGSGHGGSSGGGGGAGRSFFEEDGQGGIQLKEEYAGLRTKGYLIGASDGGPGGGGGGGGLIERLWRVGDLSDDVTDFDNAANDTFNAYTINSLHTRILALEQNPGGVSSVAGLTGAVSASDLFTALGLGTAATRAVGAIENANTGLVTGGDVYSFVNSSVATATATFRGTNTTATTEADFLTWADALTHDLNDYVFWATVDSYGNTVYKRYKYDGTDWVFEYNLNNSSFTAAQWAAINSGITSQKITGYDTVAAYFTNGVLGTANIPQLPTSKITDLDTTLTSISASITALEKMFIDDTYTVDGQTKHRLKVNSTYFEGLITTGFLIGAADGGPGGGGGGGIDLNLMWASLQNTTPDTHATDKFHKNHLPAIVAADGISAGYTLDSGNLATHLNIGISSIDMTKVSGLSQALGNKADASELNGYVLKAGDTMTGILTISVGGSSGFQDGLVLHDTGLGRNEAARIKWTSATYQDGVTLYPEISLGKLYFNNSEIYHSGNSNKADVNWTASQFISSVATGTAPLSVSSTTKVANLNADTVDGYHVNESQKPFNKIPLIGTDGVMEIGGFLDFHYDNTTGSDFSTRLVCAGNNSNSITLPSSSGTLALVTDNVASATVLQTSRRLWGNLFNGSADVTGFMQFPNGDIIYAKDGNNNNTYLLGFTTVLGLGYGSSGAGYDTYIYGNNIKLFYGTSRTQGVLLDSSGKVSLSRSLSVSGNAYFGTASSCNIWFQRTSRNYFHIASGGNLCIDINDTDSLAVFASSAIALYKDVGVGTETPSAKFHVYHNYNAAQDVNDVAIFESRTSTGSKGSALRIANGSGGIYSVKIACVNEQSTPSFLNPAMVFYTMNGTYTRYSEVERMRLTSAGNLMVGYQTDTGYKLDVSGVIHSTTGVISPGYGNFAASYSSSDQRLKDDIETIRPEYAIEKLMALRPSEWVWNEKSSLSGRKGAGLVAQHVEPVLPWILEKNGEYLSLSYDMFHPYEIGSIQFLKGETDMLKDEVAELRNRVETLESENKRLKERIYA